VKSPTLLESDHGDFGRRVSVTVIGLIWPLAR